MSDRNQEIRDYHMKELEKVHAEINRQYRRKIIIISVVGSVLGLVLLYLIIFT
jgi:hypothetical protein